MNVSQPAADKGLAACPIPARFGTDGYIGDYRVDRLLAHGGMADIYLVTDEAGNELALKALRDRDAYDPMFLLMFADEARLMQRLAHPNIVQVLDVSHIESDGFFTMEYIDGVTLLDMLRTAVRSRGEAPLELGVQTVLRAAAGAHYAHELRDDAGTPLGVVHRDLSMTNVMIGFDGSVKLIDFGVALSAHRELVTGENVVKGKVGYMSPEQCTGKPLDRRSDIFTLGILLYETTTGTRLFRGNSDYDRLFKLVHGRVPPPSQLDCRYPPDLEAVVMRALARSPEDRYATALDLIWDLCAVCDGRLSRSREQLELAMGELFPSGHAEVEAQQEAVSCEVYSSIEIRFETAAEEPDTEIMAAPPVFDASHELAGLARGTDAPRLGGDDLISGEAERKLRAGRYAEAAIAYAALLERRPGDLAARAGHYAAQASAARQAGRPAVAARYLAMAEAVGWR